MKLSRRLRDGFFALPAHWEEGTLFSPLTHALLPITRASLGRRLVSQAAIRARTPEMNVGQTLHPAPPKPSILLVDSNAERRSLRKRILSLRGVEVIGVTDLMEASSIWHRDRYDLVLMDIRNNHYGCLAWRDEIKKENPKQIVAFLVGEPRYVDLEPQPDSYVAEEHGSEWGELFRRTVREACKSLSQRNGFAEVGYRIAMARKMRGLPPRGVGAAEPADNAPEQGNYNSNDD
jgi:CheY-like chemotaxis protein